MKTNLDFTYAEATNFLPFGPDGVKIEFKKYGNIVLIQGENHDAKPIDSDQTTEETRISSNGSGKSSLQEIVVWTLYGDTVKRPEKIKSDQVIHNKMGRDCRCAIEFTKNDLKYRIERVRVGTGKGKDSVRLWESKDGVWDKKSELTTGDVRITQKEINKKVGLTYDAFVNICIFTDDQRSCFLECKDETKREIVENLMQLSIYRDWWDKAKSLKKEILEQVKLKTKEYSLLLTNKDDAARRLELTEKNRKDWLTTKAQELSALEKRIADKKESLGKSNIGQALLLYQQAQEKIASINQKIPELEDAREKILQRQELVKQKDAEQKKEAQGVIESFNTSSSELKSYLKNRKDKEAEIADLESEVPGTRCTKCRGVVTEENVGAYIQELKREIADIDIEIKARKLTCEQIEAKINEIKANQTKLSQLGTQAEQKRNAIDSELSKLRTELTTASQIREPKAESAELLIQQQLEELNRQLSEKKKEVTGSTPFDDMLITAKDDLAKSVAGVEDKEKEVKDLEGQIPYFDYWIFGFGPLGIRKWVIDGIIPDLNARVNYWLQYLIDNKITLKFDNELVETIERNPPDGDPYIYYAMSTGQRRRLNLSVGHSFAYITELSAESIPSIIFLDEVTTNVDPLGVQGIYNMICELAQDKQVFVTTHDPDLVRMLQGASVIKLVHENGFTRKV